MINGNKKKKDKESHKGLYIFFSVIFILLILLSLTFTHPVMMLAPFWDHDVREQLLEMNRRGIEIALLNQDIPENTQMYFRLIYENNDDTDIRIQRAIDVYYELFTHSNNSHEVVYLENQTLLEFTWWIEEGI